MRKLDKLKNIQKANTLAEQRHLQSKNLLNENDGPNHISVVINRENGEKSVVKGQFKPTEMGFVITQQDDDKNWNGKPFNIIWDKEAEAFINGEAQWFEKQPVTPSEGHEQTFARLKSRFKSEARSNDTYFETLSSALDHVRQMAQQMGYEADDKAIWDNFGTGGISYGQTKKGLIPLLKDGQPIIGKDGKELNRAISVAIYRMDSGKYELTAYKTF